MCIRKAALAATFAFCGPPAFAQDFSGGHAPRPHPIAAVMVQNRPVELLAVTRRARADTPLRRAYMEECEAMAKVMPGYPQQPWVSFDIRVKF